MSAPKPVLTEETMNPHVKNMQYAVRGPIVLKAAAIEKKLAEGVEMPFTEVVRANIGDCHATGQIPLTFLRQVLSLATYPELLNDSKFPDDVKERVKRLLGDCKGGSLGSYSASPGLEIIRKDVAQFIQDRDGHSCDYNNIFLSTGASAGIKIILELLNSPGEDGKKPGVMIPIPQYPLYSATLTEFNMHQINYYLNEDDHWALDIAELQRAIDAARDSCHPRAICVINPGNPTGQVLSKENIQSIIEFAHKEGLFILADEVYQHNIYDPSKQFHSFKKVLSEMGPAYATQQLASFMSTSKGYMGECGLRGGYFEVVNLDSATMALLNKCLTVSLCPPVTGQVVMDCVVNPPKPGDSSYELHAKEKKIVLDGLKAKAELISNTFNAIEGISCNSVQGAMYCFPKVDIPPRAVQHAKSQGMTPDSFYCFELLEKTGLCVVPGSGFGQREGTHHFRTTILPQIEKFHQVMEKFVKFHKEFLAEWK